jgi:hypothetical protein
MTPRQLLTRYSFQSLFRSEAMSEAGIDAYRAWLMSIGIALVCFHFHFARVLAKKYGFIAHTKDHALFFSAVAADELFYLSASFVFTTLLATLQWQSLFPGERDFQILSPLPIARSDIFLARITALAWFLSMFLLAFNLPPSLMFPILSRSQSMWSLLLSSLGASLQAFFSVLALQGLCLTLLPHRLRSKASFLIQSALLIGAIAFIPVVWHMPGLNRRLDTRAEWLTWIPPVWWLGVCERLRGSTDQWHYAMANRAMMGGGAAILIAAGTYLNLYRRFSDFASPARPVAKGPSKLLWLARRDDSGTLAFLAWTLTRSAQHRLILSAIAAVGASLALDGFISTYIRQWTRGRDAQGLFLESALALPLLLTFSLTAALRMSFRIPHEWRANWIFKLAEDARYRPDQLEATVVAMYWIAVVPAVVIAVAFQYIALGPLKTLAAISLLFALNACLVEFTLQDWQRLPFTATYAPSHTPAAISFVLFIVAFSIYGWGGAELARVLIQNPMRWFLTAASLFVIWRFLRRKRCSHWGFEPFTFADDGDPTVQVTNFAPE